MASRTRFPLPAACLALSLAACGAPPSEPDPGADRQAPVATRPDRAPAPAPAPKPAAPAPGPLWRTAASGEGDALFLAGPDGRRTVTFFCPAESEDLLLNVTGFRPIGSEERMTFGAGGIAVTLVTDSRGDPGRGGVTGRGRLPDELAAILGGPEGLAVNYGAQNSGPHEAPGAEAARQFLQGCRD